MKIQLLLFGISKDIVGHSELEVELRTDSTVTDLKQVLVERFPDFEHLRSFSVAVNNEYRKDDFLLSTQDEIAIIPPVSGG